MLRTDQRGACVGRVRLILLDVRDAEWMGPEGKLDSDQVP